MPVNEALVYVLLLNDIQDLLLSENKSYIHNEQYASICNVLKTQIYRLIYARNITGRTQWMEIVVASKEGKWVMDKQKLFTACIF